MKQHSIPLPKYGDIEVNLPRVPFVPPAAISKTKLYEEKFNSLSKMEYAATACVREALGLNFGGNTDYPEVIRGFL
jgi:hypothetical protein